MNRLTFNETRHQATGRFQSLSFGLDIELNAILDNWKDGKPPLGDETGPGRPAYSVSAISPDGELIELQGAVWMGKIKRGPNAGKDFLRITADDMSFPAPLNLTAWELKGGKEAVFEIKWERPRRAANAA
ncbi:MULTISPECIES: DUF736 family protein [Thalassospira]|uniref:DUF736 family protein n=1 Tax=Thalassospira TaxID=168934 RepID=UPI0008DCB6E1|nr:MULTISPECIES: DUF736 family protein [Thalassospira]MDM7975416.1 DUF736 family protein [Thalassospira xiamenensis]OHZ00817.1 hypothetical protein BC440_08140 [Thalassospira sp. MIT1004]